MRDEDESKDEKDKKGKTEKEKQIERLRRLKEQHKGEWITFEDCKEYYLKAQALPNNGYQDIGERRQLRMELQKKFDLSETEAINILNGYHVHEYVQKYDNIRNLRIPDGTTVNDRVYVTVVRNEGYDFEEKN